MRMRIWPASVLATALLLLAATASPLLAIDNSDLVVKGHSSPGHPGTHLGSPASPGSPGDDDMPNRSGRAPAPIPYVGPNVGPSALDHEPATSPWTPVRVLWLRMWNYGFEILNRLRA
jgi:hypothetical protein